MVMPAKQTASAFTPAAQKAAALLRKEKKEIVVSPTCKAAIEAMVFEGMKRSAAAEQAGMADISLRQALLKPHVLAYLNECQEVLRTSLRPRALHTMGELLDDKSSTVKFKAAEYLDGLNRGQHTVGATVNVQVNNTVSVTPGYVLDLRPDQQASAPQIEHLGPHDANDLEVLIDVPVPE